MSAQTRELFAGVFARGEVAAELSDAAWVRALLEVEAGLARALAKAGLVTDAAAAAVVAAADPAQISIEELAQGCVAAGNPVPALVKRLETLLPPSAASALHRGATSQDVVDSALMLIAKRALSHVLADLDAAAKSAAALADQHRASIMLGRTLLQAATPITFGLAAAGWLWSLDDASVRLAELREQLPAQLGGAAGTLAPLADRGAEVARFFAAELGLREPVLPWHTLRAPILRLASACGVATAALGKIARDVSLLAQTELDEVREHAARGRGASSTMPHKQNPIGSIAALSCTRRIPGLLATVFAAAEQEHQRAAGSWHAEWETLSEILGLLGAAASWMREVLENLTVDVERMRANFDAALGLPFAERLRIELPARLGREPAATLLQTAIERARRDRRSLREVLSRDADLAPLLQQAGFDDAELDRAFDPHAYLGSAASFIDRALAHHASRRPNR
jgi:3-carboxy-cis,cis-muconate cycloisomerase